MRDIRTLSGPWTGQWVQWLIRGRMRLHLRFMGEAVTGSGADQDGPFAIHGVFEEGTQRLVLYKQYPFLTVVYDGTWNGEYVAGHSIIGRIEEGERGSFEIWPESEDVSLEALLAEEVGQSSPGT